MAEIAMPPDLKTRIEKVLSEIYSDIYGCKVTLHFEKRTERTERDEEPRSEAK